MEWGGSGITEELYNLIIKNIPQGSTIVELGAGDVSTPRLCEIYDLYSVEDNPSWINKYGAKYIYAPLVDGWYNRVALMLGLPTNYSLLIVDGPCGDNRFGILHNLDLFRNVPIIIDDTYRDSEKNLASRMAEALGKNIVDCGQFSVLVNK